MKLLLVVNVTRRKVLKIHDDMIQPNEVDKNMTLKPLTYSVQVTKGVMSIDNCAGKWTIASKLSPYFRDHCSVGT